MKKIICLILLSITLTLSLGGCFTPDIEEEHNNIKNKINRINEFYGYESVYSYYIDYISHIKSHNQCSLPNSTYEKDLYKFLLFGKWEDDSDNFIMLFRESTNYNDTHYKTYLKHNLKTSQISGNEYHFYLDTKSNKLVIGYENQANGQKVENFLISFHSDHIILVSYIDNKTYTMFRDNTYQPYIEYNAKFAYDAITTILGQKFFDSQDEEFDASTFTVKECYSNNVEDYVDIIASWTSKSGEDKEIKIKITQKNVDNYTVKYITTKIETNINVSELNDMIEEYLNSQNQ